MLASSQAEGDLLEDEVIMPASDWLALFERSAGQLGPRPPRCSRQRCRAGAHQIWPPVPQPYRSKSYRSIPALRAPICKLEQLDHAGISKRESAAFRFRGLVSPFPFLSCPGARLPGRRQGVWDNPGHVRLRRSYNGRAPDFHQAMMVRLPLRNRRNQRTRGVRLANSLR